MAGRTERPALLPPPLAAWLASWLIRGTWAAAGIGLIYAWVALEAPTPSRGAASSEAAVTLAAGPSAPAAGLASPPASRTRPAPGPPVRAPSSPRLRPTAPAPTRPSARSAPPAVVPPAPGQYGYVITSDSQSSSADLVVTRLGGTNGASLLEEDWSTAAGTERRGEKWSSSFEQEQWSSDGDYQCVYRPPSPWLDLPLLAGRAWQGTSRCTYQDQQGQPVELEQSVAARVVTGARTDFGGQRTFCWVVERDVLSTVTTSGTAATSETRTTDLFAPSLGLVLYQTGKVAYPDDSGNIRSYTWTARLDS